MEEQNFDRRVIALSRLQLNSGQLEGLPKNPRIIHDEKFKRLVESMREDPEFLEIRELAVVDMGGDRYVIAGGNMRYRAAKELGMREVPCKVIPRDYPMDKIRRFVLKDNGDYGDNDWDALLNEWDTEEIESAGFDIPDIDVDGGGRVINETEEEAIERKKREFDAKMEAGELDEDDPEYQEFLKKFEAKKTTDDCYTPEIVYDAVADWVANEYNVSRANFIRPFYPGGDYQKENYKPTDIVVDNPPFSILASILDWYNERGIKYFLFGPQLTMLCTTANRCTCLPVGVQITYANGANVNTSFATNLESEEIVLRGDSKLYKAVNEANLLNLKESKKELPKYSYPKHVIMSPTLHAFARYGIDFTVKKDECYPISELDSQKTEGKAIYGKGYLISDRLVAEREKAEREKAEREKAERENMMVWELSEREKEIIKSLK